MKRLPRPVLQALPAVFGLLLAFAIAGSRGLHAASGAVRWAALSDGCFVSGILETGFGALLRISQTGFFDIFSFAAHSLLVLFTPLRRPEDMPDYLTWRALRAERRPRPGRALLAAGLLFLLASALLLVLSRQQSI